MSAAGAENGGLRCGGRLEFTGGLNWKIHLRRPRVVLDVDTVGGMRVSPLGITALE